MWPSKIIVKIHTTNYSATLFYEIYRALFGRYVAKNDLYGSFTFLGSKVTTFSKAIRLLIVFVFDVWPNVLHLLSNI